MRVLIYPPSLAPRYESPIPISKPIIIYLPKSNALDPAVIYKRLLCSRHRLRLSQHLALRRNPRVEVMFPERHRRPRPDVCAPSFSAPRYATMDGRKCLRRPLGFKGAKHPEEAVWAAAGFKDTLLRWKMKPEVVHGNEKAVQPRVQA